MMRELLVNVTVIVFLTTIMDLLLPNGKMQPFIRMVMGLFIIVTILNPLVRLVEQDSWLDSWILTENLAQDSDSIMVGGADTVEDNTAQLLSQYAEKLQKQVNALVGLADGVLECRTDIQLADRARLGEIGYVEKVRVYVKGEQNAVELPQRLQKMLCSYYDWADEVVEVQME